MEMVGAQDELEAKECEAEPQERDEAQLEAAQPQAALEEQLARLGYRQAQAVVHSNDTLLKGAIESLCYSVLLRPVAHCVLSGNALLVTELLERFAHVFTTFVIAQTSHFLP